MWSKLKFFWISPAIWPSMCTGSSLEIAVRETLFRNASCRERRCSSANSRAFSTATETCPAAVTSTSRSRCSKTNSRSGFIATMIPEALFPMKMGAAIRHFAGRCGTWVIPRRCRAFSRSDRISSGSPVRITYSVKALRISRAAFGQHSVVAHLKIETYLLRLPEMRCRNGWCRKSGRVPLGSCAGSRPDRAAS